MEDEELYSLFNQEDNSIQKHLNIPIYSYYERNPYYNWVNVYHFMSLDHFNKLTSSEIDLRDNEFLYYINDDPKNIDRSEYYRDKGFPIMEGKLTYTLKQIIVEKYINLLSDLQAFTILSKSQFEQLKNSLDGYESNIHLINIANWEESATIVGKLAERFKKDNQNTPPITDIRAENTTEESLFEIASKAVDYNRNKNSNGILFFVTTILSVIFFFGSFILLYLNLFSEIEKEKEKYRKLNNIGITSKEVKQIILKEKTSLFFLPTIVGTILAFLYIIAMARDDGGVLENPQILLHFLIVAGIYYLIQIGFYLYSRKKMVCYLTR